MSCITAASAVRSLALAASALSLFPGCAIAQHTTLEPVIVTAGRHAQVAADVLSDTVVITADEIERSGDRSLVDLLQRQRGIEIARNGGRGANTSVYVRGAENNQNIVLIDGVRVGSATSGGANWSAIPLSQIERVEIVYGPLSGLYGADAMGGVIQIFTKRAAHGVQPNAAVTIGSRGTRILEAGVAASSERLSFNLGAANEESDGFSSKKPGASGYNPDRDGYDKRSLNARLGYTFSKGHELSASLLQSRLENQYDNSALRDDRQVQHLDTYALNLDNQINASWTSRAQLARSYDKNTNFTTTQSHFNTRQTHASWQNDFSIGKSDLLQLVLERRKEEVASSDRVLNRARATNSFAAAYQLKRGAHLGSASLRHDDNSQFGGFTTGSLGYGYRLSDAWRANASYGTSFRAPTFNELYAISGTNNYGVPTNRPERGKNAELGLVYDSGASRFSATYYHNRISDLIVRIAPCPLPGYDLRLGCPYNVNRALLKGVSLAASTRSGNLVYRGTLDLQDPKDETTGKRLARRAHSHGTLALEYDTGAFLAGAETVFSSNRFDNASNTTRLPGYGLVNLYAHHDFAPNWTLFGRWNNVFDKDYEVARGYATEGSALFVGVRYALK